MSGPSVIVVGAGPAGLSAAVTAATAGIGVTVIDERLQPGGRLRYDRPGTRSLADYLSDCDRLGVQIRSRTIVWGLFPGWRLPLETPAGAEVLETEHVILAPGAIDRGLAFDGNGLPGVMTGTALRRLIGEYGVLPGKRVLILGNGQDAAATADAVRQAGGQVIGLVAESDARSISIQGEGAVERVIVDGKERPADIVAVAVGRQPDLQLATMGGHQMVWMPHKGGWSPHHSPEVEDNPEGLYVTGDAAGSDTIEICELDGAFAATRLAARLGLVAEEAIGEIVARIEQRRPDRMNYLGHERLHRQPWLVPFEVNR